MDVLKLQLARIQEQLAGLTASQRMLVGSLLAIIVMTLLFWSRYAADPEMVPVLDSAISANDMPGIKGALKSAGIDAKVVNDRIMVPAEQQLHALGILGYGRLLPSDSSKAWDEIVNQQSNPFESADKAEARKIRAKEVMLSHVLQNFPGVTRATVMIDATHRRMLRPGGDVEPTASISIDAKPTASVDEILDSASAMVSNAQAGLKRSRIAVVINGRSYRPRDVAEEDGAYISADRQKELRNWEEYYIKKIEKIMMFPAAVVTVTAAMNSQSSEETRKMYDEKSSFQKERTIEVESSETQAGGTVAAQEPGAQANMSLSIDGAGAGQGGSTTMERQRTENETFPSEIVSHTKKPGGDVRVLRASVRLPRSAFIKIWQNKNRPGQQPDDAVIDDMINKEIELTKKQVTGACGVPEDDVAVSVYEDLIPMFASSESEVASGGGGTVSVLLQSHVKEIAIGFLAIASLFMVSMMVRRNSAPVAVASVPVALKEIAPLATDEDIAGEVGEGSAMLDGMELDEDTIKAQQMVEQVSTMVKENPDAAANLVKRWLNRS